MTATRGGEGGTYVVTADGRGSRVRAAIVIRLRGIARLAEPILWARSRRELREDLRRLSQLLEASKTDVGLPAAA